MTLSSIDQLAVTSALVALLMCGGTLVRTQLLGLALQGALLVGICIVLSIQERSSYLLLLALAIMAIKVGAIPLLLDRTAGRMKVVRDKGSSLHPTLALLSGLGLLALGYWLSPHFEVTALGHPIAAGMAVASLFIGIFLMIIRRLAISQVIGFLTLDNAISLYSLTQTRSMPLLLEMSIVFEVLVGVLIAALVIYRISRSFEHLDAAQLRGLRH